MAETVPALLASAVRSRRARSFSSAVGSGAEVVLHREDAILNFTGSIPGGPDAESRNALVAAITSMRLATVNLSGSVGDQLEPGQLGREILPLLDHIILVVAMVLHREDAILNFTGSIPGGPDAESRNALVAAIAFRRPSAPEQR
jgi:hypothetical protein